MAMNFIFYWFIRFHMHAVFQTSLSLSRVLRKFIMIDFFGLIDYLCLNPVDLSHINIEQNVFDSDLKDQVS